MRSVDRNVVMRRIHVFPAHILNKVNKLMLTAINRTEKRKHQLAEKTGFSDGCSTVCRHTKARKVRRELPDKIMPL